MASSAYCNNCDGPSGCQSGESCCWARAVAIKKFKKRVFYKYIIEVMFDVAVSVISVVTDIISIVQFFRKNRWVLGVVTMIPVLLPTVVFTNVYMNDDAQAYRKLQKNKRIASRTISETDDPNGNIDAQELPSGSGSPSYTTQKTTETTIHDINIPMEELHDKLDYHCSSCHMWCYSCKGCVGGMLKSIFHYDKNMRKSGVRLFKKSMKRMTKYFLGTFVLRFISLAWYAKAFIFGIRAFREPKKYMKLAIPSTHWSYDLLVKLDFLQAALENAPQCIIQLYVLLSYPGENVALGMITLFFSFLDFVRVCVSVQWDMHKGPVIAPSGCYGSYTWKLINMSSWIFVFIGRSAALALVIATVRRHWSIAIPLVILVVHTLLFAKLFSQSKYGAAAQKIIVSVFISYFFLPEIDSSEVPLLIQFYYAVVHVENVFFIVPWNGVEHKYCIQSTKKQFVGLERSLNENMNITDNLDYQGRLPFDPGPDQDCLISPVVIIILVPTLTMLGIVMRLAASQRMSDFKKSLPARPDKIILEERIANIYSKRWSAMPFSVLLKSFLRMLKKEVVFVESESNGGITEGKDADKDNFSTHSDNAIYFISPSLNKEFKTSQRFLREAISFLSAPTDGESNMKTQRSMSVDVSGLSYRGRLSTLYEETIVGNGSFEPLVETKRCRSHDNVKFDEIEEKEEFLTETIDTNSLKIDGDFELVKVETPNGPYFLEMSWI